MQIGSYMMAVRDREGFLLMAPLTYWSATEEEIEEQTGGCGPGKIGDAFVPDTLYGESVFLACQIHDKMYHDAMCAEDKLWADLTFQWNMTYLIKFQEGALDFLRLRRVMSYFQAVDAYGKTAYDKRMEILEKIEKEKREEEKEEA